jgi:hypothetical protein
MEAKEPQAATLGNGALFTYYTQEQLQKKRVYLVVEAYLALTALLSIHILLHFTNASP